MTAIDKLRDELALYERCGRMTPVGYAYTGWAEFLRREGEEFEVASCPQRLYMRPGFCYGNAIVTSVNYGLAYVEGFALPGSDFPAVPHAWNLDERGKVIDSTWAMAETRGAPVTDRAYLGVRFSVRRADEATWDGDASVLDDWKRKWPLLREPWQGEDSPGDMTGLHELLTDRYRAARGREDERGVA